MTDHDISTAEALARLSSPTGRPDDDRHALSRRRFLQAVGAGVGGAALGAGAPGLFGVGDHTADAAPIDANDGIVVLIGMYGGNDGLRMVAPVGDANYRRLRSSVYVTPEQGLDIGEGFRLAPELTSVKSMWDADQVAVVHGAGYANANLSHFSSMAYWMAGRPNGVPSSGWIGRWLDTTRPDLFRSVTVGHSIPLHMQGVKRRSIAVPEWGMSFGGLTQPEHRRAYRAFKKMAVQPATRGPWAAALGQSVSDTIDVAQKVSPIFDTDVPEASDIAQKLIVAARLINANLGFRVLDAGWGDFDHHSGEITNHPDRMTEFDEAIRRFYETLDASWRKRVTIMTFSEFGRTPWDNDSDGTDHGTCHPMLVIGHRVKGGHYGEPPDIRPKVIKEEWDRMEATTDFRRVYASMLDWLGCGSATIKAVLDTASSRQRTPIDLFVGGPTL